MCETRAVASRDAAEGKLSIDSIGIDLFIDSNQLKLNGIKTRRKYCHDSIRFDYILCTLRGGSTPSSSYELLFIIIFIASHFVVFSNAIPMSRIVTTAAICIHKLLFYRRPPPSPPSPSPLHTQNIKYHMAMTIVPRTNWFRSKSIFRFALASCVVQLIRPNEKHEISWHRKSHLLFRFRECVVTLFP